MRDGVRLSCLATCFGEAWAEETYGAEASTTRIYGYFKRWKNKSQVIAMVLWEGNEKAQQCKLTAEAMASLQLEDFEDGSPAPKEIFFDPAAALSGSDEEQPAAEEEEAAESTYESQSDSEEEQPELEEFVDIASRHWEAVPDGIDIVRPPSKTSDFELVPHLLHPTYKRT